MSGSREKYPAKFTCQLTSDLARRADERAHQMHIKRNELIRRALEHALVCPLFLSDGSTDRSVRPEQQG